MSERLHYFTEATTAVSFDCSDSDIDSDLEDSRRPISPTDRAKQHARQLQLWSDEARQRRRGTLHASPQNVERARPPADRQQSNLSERARMSGNGRRVARSQSAKNLRIRVTPSSSSKSLLSDVSEHNEHAQTSLPMAPFSLPSSPMPITPAHKSLPTRITILQPLNRPERVNENTVLSDQLAKDPEIITPPIEKLVTVTKTMSAPYESREVKESDYKASCNRTLPHGDENMPMHRRARRSTTNARSRGSHPLSLLMRRARSSAAGTDRFADGRSDETGGRPSLSRRMSFSRAVKRLSLSRLWKRC